MQLEGRITSRKDSRKDQSGIPAWLPVTGQKLFLRKGEKVTFLYYQGQQK